MFNYSKKPIPATDTPHWDEVQNIPIKECGEELLPLSLAPPPIQTYPVYYKMGIPSAVPECYTRSSIYTRLIDVSNSLPDGLQLIILDCWRPIELQRQFFESFTNLLKTERPLLSEAERYATARNLVAPPSESSSSPSPHITGGAVDLTLADSQGRMLDMGSAFDEASPRAITAYLENQRLSDDGQIASRDNRRILYNAMLAAGFTNLPSEWWHYDYGDQLWAWLSGQQYAQYGPVRPPSMEQLWSEQLQSK